MVEEIDMEYKSTLNDTNQERTRLESDLYNISCRDLEQTIPWTSQMLLDAKSEEPDYKVALDLKRPSMTPKYEKSVE